MMICFRETTFWAKTSLSFVFRGPNSVHPEVFRCVNHNGTNFKAVWWSVSQKPHFGLKHHFPLYLEGQTPVHPEVFRHANHNGTSSKGVWWSVSEKPHFGLKDHFPLYLEGQTQCMLTFSGVPITMVQGFQISKLYDDLFLRKNIQSCMMICFRETTFWAKTSLSFVFRGPNSVHPEVFRCANHNGTNFKAVWWSVSEKPHFGLKHHFPLYLEGQTQCTLRFSGVSITMVQISKLYDDLFQRNHILS